jgi:hypothetical protein
VIIRVKHENHYTVARNKTIRDSRISFRATGVLVYLLSLPDDTSVSARALAETKPEGKYAIGNALEELRTAGYLSQERVRGERGQWVTVTTVRERPLSDATLRVPVTGTRSAGTRRTGRYVRSTKEKAKTTSSPFLVNGPCTLCPEPATVKDDHGALWCPAHQPEAS